jgi:hypothetical protein
VKRGFQYILFCSWVFQYILSFVHEFVLIGKCCGLLLDFWMKLPLKVTTSFRPNMDSIYSPANFKMIVEVRPHPSQQCKCTVAVAAVIPSSVLAVCQLSNFTQCRVHNPARKSTELLNQYFLGVMEQAHLFLFTWRLEYSTPYTVIEGTAVQGLLFHAFAFYCAA